MRYLNVLLNRLHWCKFVNIRFIITTSFWKSFHKMPRRKNSHILIKPGLCYLFPNNSVDAFTLHLPTDTNVNIGQKGQKQFEHLMPFQLLLVFIFLFPASKFLRYTEFTLLKNYVLKKYRKSFPRDLLSETHRRIWRVSSLVVF